jgi:hypothetical protein
MFGMRTSQPITSDEPATPSRSRGRRRVLALGTSLCLLSGLLALATTEGASASLAPATYSGALASCTTIQGGGNNLGYVDAGRPIAVAHYTGTSYLYFTAYIFAYEGGKWVSVGSGASAYAHIWGQQGQQLTPIYWGNAANNYGFSFAVTPGYSYKVVGETDWWNGSSWFTSNDQSLVQCNL